MEAEAAQQQGNKPSSKASERQAQISRLVSTYRAEANTLLKDVLKQQHRWRNELQEQGVLTGIPNMRPYVKTLPHVRRRLNWKQAERDALKRQLMGLGLGRWKEIHSALSSSFRHFKHGPGDVEDACWQLLGELQLLLVAPEDRLLLARLMEPVAEWGPISTPGAPFSKLQGSAKSIVRRLALLQDFNALMPALQRSEAVAGMIRALIAAAVPAAAAPASWWDVECDVALMVGMHRHGYANYEAVRQDPDLTAAFQGFHPPARSRAAPAASDTPADGTPGATLPAGAKQQQSDAVSEGGPAASAQSSGCAGDAAAGAAAVSDTAQTNAPGSGAAGAAADDDAWPPAEVLSKRVRQLCELLAQAVAAADAQGLLQPLPEAVTGSAAADAALKGKFLPTTPPQLAKQRAGLVFYGSAAGTAAGSAAGIEPFQHGLDHAAAAGGGGGGFSAADAAAAWSARDRSRPGSPGMQNLLPNADLALDDGDVNELLGDLAGADSLDAELHCEFVPHHRELHSEGPGSYEEEEDQEDEEAEDQWAAQEAAAAASGFAAMWRQQQPQRGRGRGRGRVGRPSKSAVVASLAAEAAEAAEAAGGEGSRRRRHQPSTRYAEHVLFDAADGAEAGASGGRDREVGIEVTKKTRKELHNLIMTWGLPPPAEGADIEAAAAAADGAAGAAAVLRASDYDWDAWAGRAVEMPAPLRRVGDDELTTMLKELLSEMDEFNSAAAAGTVKPRNLHNPACECVVCTNRRRFEERKQQEAAESARAAAAAAGASEEEQAAAAAAAAAAVAGGGADAGEAAESKASKAPPPKGEVLSVTLASKLLERLEQLAAFRAALPLLRSPALDGAFKRGTKDLPGWWGAQQDEGLVAGVLQHGFGNWGPMFEDPSLPFKATASAAAAAGYDADGDEAAGGGKGRGKGAKGGAGGLPDWAPELKALTKRCKSIAAAIKKALSKPPPAEKKSAGPKAGKGGAQGGKGAVAAAAAGGGGGGAASMQQQQQQLAAMAMLQQAAPAAAAAAGSSSFPGMLPAGNLQQRQQQLYMLQQQQQQQAVLGKRSAAMAGLPTGPEAAAAAAVGGATPATSSAAPSPSAAAAAGSNVAAAAAAAASTGAAPAGPPMLVMAGPSIAANVAAMSVPPLTPRQMHELEVLPRLMRDAAGKPVLPLLLSKEQSLLSLGRVEPTRPGFHTSSHIFPLGYTASAKFPSSVQPGVEVAYTCMVADGGPAGPLFVVVVPDAPGQQWLGPSPDAVWQQVQQRVQQVQQRLIAADGYQLYGLNHPLVAMLIQELPGAERCEAFRPAESAAPHYMTTAMRQAQQIMAQKVQQAQAEAASALLQQQQVQQHVQQAQQQHALQQQLLRMQQTGQQQQQQQQGGQASQQQQLMALMQQRQALQQQALMQQQALLQQQEHAVKRRRTSAGIGGPMNIGMQTAAAPAAAPAAQGANLVQQYALLQQQQQRQQHPHHQQQQQQVSPVGAQLSQQALQQLNAVMQQPQFQQMSPQQQQALLRQLAVGLQHQQQ